MTTDDERQASGAVTQAVAAVASLAEAWLRDTAVCAVVLLSLGVVLAAFTADGACGRPSAWLSG